MCGGCWDVLGSWVSQVKRDGRSQWVCQQIQYSVVSSQSRRLGPSTVQYQTAAVDPSLTAADHLQTCPTTLYTCGWHSPSTVYAVSSLWSDCSHVELRQQQSVCEHHRDQLVPAVAHYWCRCSNTYICNPQQHSCRWTAICTNKDTAVGRVLIMSTFMIKSKSSWK